MDPKNNQASSSAAPGMRSSGGSTGVKGMKNNNKLLVIIAVVVAVLAIAGALVWKQMMSSSSAVKGGQYQAVFLTNGQVYFGKLANVEDKYVRLSDIYYLQVQQSVQPADKNNTQPQVSLAKLGSELHGPEDAMQINRDQVLFWENLKDDGKVVKAIQDNKK
jgi:hypothetical protein